MKNNVHNLKTAEPNAVPLPKARITELRELEKLNRQISDAIFRNDYKTSGILLAHIQGIA